MLDGKWMHTGVRITGGVVLLCAVVLLILAPIVGKSLFGNLWGVEPIAYIGIILLAVGLGVVAASYMVPAVIARWKGPRGAEDTVELHWSQVTQRYFELTTTTFPDLYDGSWGRSGSCGPCSKLLEM